MRSAVNLPAKQHDAERDKGAAQGAAPAAGFADLTRCRKRCPVDIQQEEAYAPVVYLKEKTWLLRAGKFCKARST